MYVSVDIYRILRSSSTNPNIDIGYEAIGSGQPSCCDRRVAEYVISQHIGTCLHIGVADQRRTYYGTPSLHAGIAVDRTAGHGSSCLYEGVSSEAVNREVLYATNVGNVEIAADREVTTEEQVAADASTALHLQRSGALITGSCAAGHRDVVGL